jgi:plastocyanin
MTSITRRSVGILGLGFAAAAATILRTDRAHAEDTAIHIDNFSFAPQQLTVKAGTKVTWTNRDDIPHNVVCAGKFRSKTMDTEGTFEFMFATAGEYKYFCGLHPHMTGVVKVE